MAVFPVWPLVVFSVVAVAGVFYAKWDPYFHKIFHVAVTHSLGPSIVSGNGAAAPAPSFPAAWGWGVQYFKAIWVALIVGLLVGSGVEALLPRRWLWRVLGNGTVRSSALAGCLAIPSMMCTCCSAPIAVGMGKSRVSTGAIFAYWVGNPVLNPATLIFMGFVLGWNWAAFRILAGLGLVALAALIGDRMGKRKGEDASLSPPAEDAAMSYSASAILGRWVAALRKMVYTLLPEYAVIVLLLGAARAWLFPAMDPAVGHALWIFPFMAVAGTLFVVPTAGEVPIIQTLIHHGLGIGPAGVLLITLPAVSLPSLVMVGRVVPVRILLVLAGAVAGVGVLTGLLAQFVL
ncbi:MAG: permease [Betaproteobacteria bacterium]|nr:permease [Betaproteobacteria bacterium]